MVVDLEEYGVGNIVRIRMWDFLAYEYGECIPGPCLNMIVGPNGCGKSSIVGAITLGLGAQTNVFGRATSIDQFIRYGKDQAMIEVTIKGENGGLVEIRRTIKKNGESVWQMDGKKCTMGQVIKLVKGLKIQMDNLCQVLPQDRVFEFSKMNRTMLLAETQRGIFDHKHGLQYEELVKGRKIEREFEGRIGALKKECGEVLIRKEELKELVDKYNEQIQRCEKLEMLRGKKTWIEHNKILEEIGRKKGRMVELKDEREEHGEILGRARQHQLAMETSMRGLEMNMVGIEEEWNVRREKMDEIGREIEGYGRDIKLGYLKMDTLKEREQTRQDRIQVLRQEIGVIDERMGKGVDMDVLEKISEEVDEKRRRKEELERMLDGIEDEKKEIEREGDRLNARINEDMKKLEMVENNREQRLRMIRQVALDTFLGYEWMMENRHVFKGRVYGPVCMEIQVKDNRYVSIVEHSISRNVMMSFVFEEKDDYEMFLREMYDIRKYKIDVILCHSKQEYVSKLNREELVEYGFEMFLHELIECPDLVLEALCDQAKIHLQPVSINDKVVFSKVDRDVRISKYCAGQTGYEIQRNEKGESMAVISKHIRKARILDNNVDPETKSRLLEDLSVSRAILQKNCDKNKVLFGKEKQWKGEYGVVEGEWKELVNKKNKMVHEINEQKNLENVRQVKEMELRRLEESRNMEEMKEEIEQRIKQLYITLGERMAEYGQISLDIQECMENRIRSVFEHMDLDKKLGKSRIEMDRLVIREKELDEKWTCLESEMVLLENRREKMEGMVREGLVSRWENRFLELPDQIGEIEDMIEDIVERLEIQGKCNPRVIEQFEETSAKLDRLEADLENAMSEYNRLVESRASMAREWEERMEGMVEGMNERFSRFFEMIRCAGEIRLYRPGRRYEEWGIEILVKFRSQESFHVLDGERFSGGERSLTTILYLLAMQEMGTSPIRIVDEINQGMDAINERIVHNLIVDISTNRHHHTQYFLVTPKLLEGLDYNEHVRVVCVHSGHWIEPESETVLGTGIRLCVDMGMGNVDQEQSCL